MTLRQLVQPSMERTSYRKNTRAQYCARSRGILVTRWCIELGRSEVSCSRCRPEEPRVFVTFARSSARPLGHRWRSLEIDRSIVKGTARGLCTTARCVCNRQCNSDNQRIRSGALFEEREIEGKAPSLSLAHARASTGGRSTREPSHFRSIIVLPGGIIV